MQDFADLSYTDWHKVVDNMVMEQVYTLRDKRDNNDYKIAKLKDGKVWMVQGLRLVNYLCTPTDSDMESGSFQVPATNIDKFVSSDDNNDAAYYNNDEDDGAYYTWHTATAGTGTASTFVNVDATSSICPKGWKLPKGGAEGSATSDFVNLVKAYGGSGNNDSGQQAISSKLMASPAPNLTYAGLVNYNDGTLYLHGSNGVYWSRTAYSASDAYVLSFDSGDLLYPAYYGIKCFGFSVRGILQEPTLRTVKLYGSRGTKATQLSKVYLPVDGKAKQINKIYGSVNGQTRLIFNHYTAPPLIERLTYMQDVYDYSLDDLKRNMPLEKPYTLIDKRDNTPYKVALLKDGNIWMCENLRIGSNDKVVTFSSAYTDMGVDKPYTMSLPQGSTSGFSGDAPENLYIDSKLGGYYTWKLANAGSNLASGDSPFSISPKGWRLPKNNTGGDFSNLVKAYGGTGGEQWSLELVNKLQKSPAPNFYNTGDYDNSAYNGPGVCFLTSSTASSATTAYLSSITAELNAHVYPIRTAGKYWGLPIRCICKGNGVLE